MKHEVDAHHLFRRPLFGPRAMIWTTRLSLCLQYLIHILSKHFCFPLRLWSLFRCSCCTSSFSAGRRHGLVSRSMVFYVSLPVSQSPPLVLLHPLQYTAVLVQLCLIRAPTAHLQMWDPRLRFVLYSSSGKKC